MTKNTKYDFTNGVLQAGEDVKSVRLSAVRFQYCPVGRHWALVRPVNDSSLAGGDHRPVDRG